MISHNKMTSLDGTWRLYIAENRFCKAFAKELCDENSLSRLNIGPIDGSVPGNFELDMLRDGLIDDPFFGTNVLELQKLENRHLWYVRNFDYKKEADGTPTLRFEGIDTFADIYLNGRLIGSSDNMLIEHEFEAAAIREGTNELVVHITPSVIAARNYGENMGVFTSMKYNAGSLQVRKAAHSYGWDICPRIISGGLWKSVYLYVKKADRIDDVYLQTFSLEKNRARLFLSYETTLSGDYSTDYSLSISGSCKDSSFSYHLDRLWHNCGGAEFDLWDPLVWWPRDMGDQPLYRVKVVLSYKGEPVDSKEFDFGVRTVKLVKTDTTDDNGSGEFCFYVNGARFYARGTNWVPLDAFHSRDRERLGKALDLLYESNCNCVRCWGGNVYESEEFFDYCDRHGIMVWQDFAMGCEKYPLDPSFAVRLAKEVESVVRRLRIHPSLALWAGDNECDLAFAYWCRALPDDPGRNTVTRKTIPDVVKRLDPWRDYLPSSPYISEAAYRSGAKLPEDHLWGPRDYFKGDFYRNAAAHFASEIGYHGCPAPDSIKKFISPGKLWSPVDNDEWQVHAACMETEKDVPYTYRIPMMSNQIKLFFGDQPDSLERFSLESRYCQAEAFKYFIEHFRSEKWRRTGLIWWNLLDCWPQFSDAVVDYYFEKKEAFDFIKRSQEPVALMVREEKDKSLTLVGVNEFPSDRQVSFTVTDLADNSLAAKGIITLGSASAFPIGKLACDEKAHFFLIEYESDGKKLKNHYLAGQPPFDFDTYYKWIRAAYNI